MTVVYNDERQIIDPIVRFRKCQNIKDCPTLSIS